MEIVDANDEVNDGKKQCNIAIDIRYKKKYAIEKEMICKKMIQK